MYVEDNSGGGIYLYRVIGYNGDEYDRFVSKKRLSWAEQIEVGQSYDEALTGYVLGGFE